MITLITATTTGISLILSKVLIKLGAKDIPNERSSHQRAVSRNGGVAIVIAFYVGVLGFCLFEDPLLSPYWFEVICLSAVMAVLGLADDLFALPYQLRIAVQTIVALLVVTKGPYLQSVALPLLGHLELGVLGHIVSVLWLVGVMNVYNFMDGLNGLAAGVALILCIGLGILGAPPLMFFTLIFAIAGFFVLNFPRGRIFMGDAGSQFLGFMLGVMMLSLMVTAPSSVGLTQGPILIFAILWDTILTIVRRLRRGEHIFTAHREHLYQLLNRAGWSHASVSLVHFFFAVVQVLVAYTVMHDRISPFLGFGLLVAMQGVYTLAVFRFARRARVEF